MPADEIELDINLVYSHLLGGGALASRTSPLGVEMDLGAQANLHSFLFRADWGSLIL